MTRSLDWRTPALSVNDGRGLPTRQVVYLRTVAQDTATPLVNRQQHNASGQLAAQWDPRLPVPCLTTVYRLTGEPVQTASVDAGWRLILPGLAWPANRCSAGTSATVIGARLSISSCA